MAACDVLVNLRSPTMGETSGAVIRGALARQADARLRRRLVRRAAGRRRAAASRSTSTRCRRSPAALELAADHADELGAAARAYVAREHDLDRVADAYARALEEAAGGDAVADAVLWRIAEAAAEVGIDDVRELARGRARRGSSRERDRRRPVDGCRGVARAVGRGASPAAPSQASAGGLDGARRRRASPRSRRGSGSPGSSSSRSRSGSRSGGGWSRRGS